MCSRQNRAFELTCIPSSTRVSRGQCFSIKNALKRHSGWPDKSERRELRRRRRPSGEEAVEEEAHATRGAKEPNNSADHQCRPPVSCCAESGGLRVHEDVLGVFVNGAPEVHQKWRSGFAASEISPSPLTHNRARALSGR